MMQSLKTIIASLNAHILTDKLYQPMSIDEQIEKKVNELLDIKIQQLKLEMKLDAKPSLVLPCTMAAFKKHMSTNGKPMRDATFTAWKKRGWVQCTGRIVTGINQHLMTYDTANSRRAS